ncbi:MAG TPA: cell division protein FtsZ, partial [Gammaproteobacteria bacterium]|nr:cell division protein FtsZ [Gammaproteobacteria bacterium]
MMFKLMDSNKQQAVIKVIGVGGGGGNAVDHMMINTIEGVDFVKANTDAQALEAIESYSTIQIGASLTKGLGAGANPEIGKQAALEDKERLSDSLEGADMVFITAGMGGGTGTGAAPVIAQLAKEMGILTVAVVSRPFMFEGKRRADVADAGIEELTEHVDSLITISNQKLLEVDDVPITSAFSMANEVLQGAVQGIAELITRQGLINVDFADVTTVMQEMGKAMMGSGSASGEERAAEAVRGALFSPFLEGVDVSGARGMLVNITASTSITMGEFSMVGDAINEYTTEDAIIVIGAVIDEDMGDELRVTVVATGLDDPSEMGQKPKLVAGTEATAGYRHSAVDEGEEDLDIPTILRRNRKRAVGDDFIPGDETGVE